jgi:hypothetical protein
MSLRLAETCSKKKHTTGMISPNLNLVSSHEIAASIGALAAARAAAAAAAEQV